MNISNMVKQVQKIQEQLAGVQENLASKTVEASSGADMVVVVANGKQEIVSIKISPEVFEFKDISMLEDLVASAVNKALVSAKEMGQQEMSKITGGIKIPGITV